MASQDPGLQKAISEEFQEVRNIAYQGLIDEDIRHRLKSFKTYEASRSKQRLLLSKERYRFIQGGPLNRSVFSRSGSNSDEDSAAVAA
jgi:hypothetical protein